MRVLLTGSTGLLGRSISRVLAQRGHEVIPFTDRLEEPEFKNHYTGPYDWVVHTAALTDTKACERERERCWQVNALGTQRLRDIAKAAGARFLYISTASVFSGIEGNDKEYDIPYPQNFYNLSKFAGEIFAGEYDKTTIVRTNVIGLHKAGSHGKNFIDWLIESFTSNSDIRLFTDIIINPLSPTTIAEQLETILTEQEHKPILHLTSSDRISKAAIGKIVLKRFPTYRGTITEATSTSSGAVPTPKEMWLNSDQTAQWFVINRPSVEEEIEKIFTEHSHV
ncbi:MAG: NAD(P)-dependent oxidoreductase [bacterium]|nr:NAD(P)-dependent oxidoreductase [bacterium]